MVGSHNNHKGVRPQYCVVVMYDAVMHGQTGTCSALIENCMLPMLYATMTAATAAADAASGIAAVLIIRPWWSISTDKPALNTAVERSCAYPLHNQNPGDVCGVRGNG